MTHRLATAFMLIYFTLSFESSCGKSVRISTSKCGIQATGSDPNLPKNRIINGKEAKPNSWPWLVRFQIFVNGRQAGLCGSSLIRVSDNIEASDIVVTAAHCVVEQATMGVKPVALPVDNMIVTVGTHKFANGEANVVKRQVSAFEFHSNFIFPSKKGSHNDVAILKLSSPVKFSQTIRPICLVGKNEPIPVGMQCLTAGWGRNNSSDLKQVPDVLQQLELPVHSPNVCVDGWGEKYVEKEMICAGTLDGSSGVCQGDSGGMLACRKDTKSPWTLYGATSFGVSGTCVRAGKPAIFTRISSYVDWIESTASKLTSLK